MPKKPHISPTLFMTDTLEYTLFIIKPDGMLFMNEILRRILRHGFAILQRKRFQLSPEQAAEFYQEYEHRATYMLMVLNLSNGPIEVVLLAREDAVDHLIGLIGPEKPSDARCVCPGSLRALYGHCEDDLKNAVHGSLNLDAARREIRYFFPNFIIDPISRTEGVKLCCKVKMIGPLMTGMQQLSKARPPEPLLWLAKWLLNNNPNRPEIQEMTLKVCELQRELEVQPQICPSPEDEKAKIKSSSALESEKTSTPSSGTTTTSGTIPERAGPASPSAIICSCSGSKSSESASRKNLEKILCCCNIEVKPGEIAVCPLCEKIIQYTVPTDNVCKNKDSSSIESTLDSDEKRSTSSKKSRTCRKKEPCLPCLSKSTSTTPRSTSTASSSTKSDQKCDIMHNFLEDCIKEYAENTTEQGKKIGIYPDFKSP